MRSTFGTAVALSSGLALVGAASLLHQHRAIVVVEGHHRVVDVLEDWLARGGVRLQLLAVDSAGVDAHEALAAGSGRVDAVGAAEDLTGVRPFTRAEVLDGPKRRLHVRGGRLRAQRAEVEVELLAVGPGAAHLHVLVDALVDFFLGPLGEQVVADAEAERAAALVRVLADTLGADAEAVRILDLQVLRGNRQLDVPVLVIVLGERVSPPVVAADAVAAAAELAELQDIRNRELLEDLLGDEGKRSHRVLAIGDVGIG